MATVALAKTADAQAAERSRPIDFKIAIDSRICGRAIKSAMTKHQTGRPMALGSDLN
jgi:hypothetical protein